MIAVDTNILVRFVVEPDSGQGRLAEAFLLNRLNVDGPGFVSTIVLAEFTWTLRRVYRIDRPAIMNAVTRLLGTQQLVFEHPDAVTTALATNHPDFGDALLHAVGIAAGCSRTATFDRRFARLDGVELVQ